MENDFQKYMQRCIDLAKLGERRVAPNPMVGSVIVHKDKIIGEGYHCLYGGPHAEVNAINALTNKELLKDATLFVNLEPCAHFGKTPPCSDLIVQMQIPRVVIGTIDPFAQVAGKGIEKLEKAGCEVTVGILQEECLELNRRFFTFHREKRPYIILKWAQTADGFVDYERASDEFGKPSWITNEMARIAVHKQRSTETAIFIGTETALCDNPSLTLRGWYGKQPLRIVSDRRHRLPATLNLFDGKNETHTLSFNEYTDNRKALTVKLDEAEDTLDKLLQHLYQLAIQSVIVEGGSTMLQSFIDKNLWDEDHVYIGQLTFGKGKLAPVFNRSPLKFDRFYNSELRVYRNK